MENYSLPGGKSVLAGLYIDKNSAEEAYFNLKTHGYLASEINVLMSKETQIRYYSDKINRKEFNKTYTNSAPGGIADDFSSFGTNLKIPWPGLVVSGPLEEEFNIQDENGSSTIINAILKAGIPRDEMVRYIQGLEDGNVLITVYSHCDHKQKRPAENCKDPFLEKVFL